MVLSPRVRFLGHRRLGDGRHVALDLSSPPPPSSFRSLRGKSVVPRFVVVFAVVLLLSVVGIDPVVGGPPRYSSRIVEIQTGAIRGVILELNSRHLEPVEAFRGVPYAAPPVGPLRFRRPQPPLPWPGTRLADAFGPACPQNPPDIQNRTAALLTMPKGRYAYLKKLVPHLVNQSEDCLFLNIYVPGSDDCLKTVRFLCSDLFRSKLVRIVLIVSVIGNILIEILHVYYLLYLFSSEFVVKYLPYFSWCLYSVFAMLGLIYKTHMTHNLRKDLNLWSEESTSLKVYYDIKKEAKSLSKLIACLAVYTSASAILYALPDTNDKDMFFMFEYLQDNFPDNAVAHFAAYGIRIASVVMCYSLAGQCFQFVYVAHHAKFQIVMVFECFDEIRVRKIKNQRALREKLVFCVKRYIEIISYLRKRNDELLEYVLVILLFGGLIAMGDVTLIISLRTFLQPTLLLLLRIYTCTLPIFTILTTIFFLEAQSLENAANYRNPLLDADWYNWNLENKKILLNFLTYTTRPYMTRITYNVAMNFTLAISFVKWIFATGSVVYKLRA